MKGEPWTDPRAQPYVRIRNVSKSFDDFLAVDNLSLDIYKGELFCLLGGSGCGKTTLLRLLAGFETPSSGSIQIDGVEMAGIPPYERPVNMMFQSYALFPHMTVENNIAFGLKQDGIGRGDIDTRVQEMLQLVQLEPFAKRKPHQLSGGQRQRVALARSLAKRPKLLLLDEPLGALDKKLRESTQFELVNIQERLGITFIVVTHDQQEAMALSTRIGLMRSGDLVQVGTPTDIYEFPNSRYVADFIGSVNMFEGRIVEDEPAHVLIESDEAGGRLYIDHGVSAPPDAKVWVAVRPEKIMLSRVVPNESGYNAFEGVVKEIGYLGDQSVYLVRLGSGKTVRVTQSNLMRHTDRVSWDERVWVHWHATSGVVLNE
jgi:putrescine transport system ATP-binding protein